MPIRISQDQELELLLKADAFETTADRLPDLIARIDLHLRHQFVNKAIEEVTGISKEKYLGKTNRDLGMPKDLCDLWDGYFENVIQTGKHVGFEFEFAGTSGKRVYHARVNPQLDAKGNVESLIMITRDITKLKAQQEALLRSASTTSTNHLCRELSHHLNNPLSIVKGQIELLKIHLKNQQDERTEKSLEAIDRGIDRMTEIVKSLNKITQGSKTDPSELGHFSVSEAISMAHSLCLERKPESLVDIFISPHTDTLASGHLSDLIEALVEIIINACDSAAKASTPWVRVEAVKEQDHYLIRIVDSGSLDRKKVSHQMFLPFFTTKGPSVKGLGLNIATENLRRMGGTVSWDSSAENTTFSVKLPLAEPK